MRRATCDDHVTPPGEPHALRLLRPGGAGAAGGVHGPHVSPLDCASESSQTSTEDQGSFDRSAWRLFDEPSLLAVMSGRQAASSASTTFWGPGHVVDPTLSKEDEAAWVVVGRRQRGGSQSDRAVETESIVWPSSIKPKKAAAKPAAEPAASRAKPKVASKRLEGAHVETNRMAELRISEEKRGVPPATAVAEASSSSHSGGDGDGSGASTAESWRWRRQHELPRWGRHSTDLASIGLGETLVFATLVTAGLECKACGLREHVTMVRHHPGGCGAFEWSCHGIDIDWRWTCCGKHESFTHERLCQPTGSHPKTGCVEAPICVKCFVCPCAQLIASRKEQLDDM